MSRVSLEGTYGRSRFEERTKRARRDLLESRDLYAPTLHKDSLRLLLSVAAGKGFSVFTADVEGDLKYRVFIRAPDGMEGVPEGHLLELLVPVYGLRSAPVSFVQALSQHLVDGLGFVQSSGDPCVYRRVQDGKERLIGAYIDDLTMCLEDPSQLDQLMSELRQRFTIKEGEGQPVDWLLRMRIHQNVERGYLSMDQELAITKLAKVILDGNEMNSAHYVKHPMLHSSPLPRLAQDSPLRITNKRDFHMLSCCGSLLHIAGSTRPDVAAAVGILCRHAASFGRQHVNAAKRIVQYLYATRNMGLVYKCGDCHPECFSQGRHPKDDGTNRLVTFADSDFAMDETRRSCMGMVISMNGAPISWTSTLGKTVATSTAEAEVNAAVVAAKDSLHLRSMLQELGIDHGPIILHEDNSACIAQGNGGLRLTRPNFAGYNKSLSMGMLFLNIVLQLKSLQTLSRNLLTWKRFLSSENGCLLTCRTCFEIVLHT